METDRLDLGPVGPGSQPRDREVTPGHHPWGATQLDAWAERGDAEIGRLRQEHQRWAQIVETIEMDRIDAIERRDALAQRLRDLGQES